MPRTPNNAGAGLDGQAILTIPKQIRTAQSVSKYLEDDLIITTYGLLSKIVGANDIYLSTKNRDEEELFLRAIYRDDFRNVIQHLVWAHFLGCAVAEVIYEDGFPVLYRPIIPTIVSVNIDERGFPESFSVYTDRGIVELPKERAVYVIISSGIGYEKPLLLKLTHLLDIRNQLRNLVVKYYERHILPTTLVGYPSPSYSAEDVEQLRDMVARLEETNGLVYPITDNIGVKWDFLTPSGADINSALEAYREITREIVRALMGPVLPIYEAQFGTRAQSETHLSLLATAIAGLQTRIEEGLNRYWQFLNQLWLGKAAESQIRMTEPRLMDSGVIIENLERLVEAGIVTEQDIANLRTIIGLGISGTPNESNK